MRLTCTGAQLEFAGAFGEDPRIAGSQTIGLLMAAAGAAVGLASGHVPVAQAAPGRLIDVPIKVSGALTVAFHGDAAAGCAAHGLCSYWGTETFKPHRTVGLSFYPSDASAGYPPIEIVVGTLTERVSRTLASGSSALCEDTSDGGELPTPELRRGVLTFRLSATDAPLLGTHCAGPLDGDIARALPVARRPLTAALRGRLRVDLKGTQNFTAHGFAGTVSSTLVLALGRATSQPVPTTSAQQMREVSVGYRISQAAGSVLAAVRGDADPTACGPLDACGLTGTLRVTPRPRDRTVLELSAIGSLRRPYRDFLAALGLSRRGNPRGIGAYGSASWNGGGEVVADVSQGSECRDQTPLNASVDWYTDGQSVATRLDPLGGSDPLRTRCPGPELQSLDIAFGRVPLRMLGQRTFTVRLRHPEDLADSPFDVSASSNVSLTLTRAGAVHQHVISVLSVGSGLAVGGK